MKKNLVSEILVKIAPRIGAKVILDPEYKFAGQVIYPSGRKRYFRASSLDLNPLGSSEVAKDKGYSTFFMERMGYPVIEGQTFFDSDFAKALGSTRDIHAGYRYARELGFPVFVKPNSGSQGSGVTLVYTKVEYYKAFRFTLKRDKVVLVQRAVRGHDYRVVVLDGEVISAYKRIPLNVTGDGKRSIAALLNKKQASFIKSGRDTVINREDFRIAMNLKRRGLTMKSVPGRGVQTFLLDNANLSTGGDSVDVTRHVHPDFKEVSVRLTRDMGLRLCGVDLMINDDIGRAADSYKILEVNSAPGLDNYARLGVKQQKIVEGLYLKVLKAME